MTQQERVILIVDVSLQDREICRLYLQENTEYIYTILSATTASDALVLCQKQHIDGIILEYQLPDMNGLEFIAQLKALKNENSPPIVMVAEENVAIAVKAIKSGVEDYLVKKQMTAEQLRASVRGAMKNAEQRWNSQQCERLFSKIAATTPGLLYVYDLIEQRNIYVNRQMTELLGYTHEQFQGAGFESLLQHMHPEDLARLPAYFEQFNTAADGEVFSFEFRYRRTNGEWCWFISRETVFTRTSSGLPKQILALAQDVTQLKQTEIALRQSNERFELAAAAVNCLIYDWDLRDNTVERTCSFTDIVGYTLEEARCDSQWWRDRVHPDDLQKIDLEEFQAQLAIKDRHCYEYRVQHKDGYYLWVQDQGFVVRDDNGKPIRIVGSTTDITDRKHLELELRQRERQFSSLVENLPDIIFRLDRNLRHLYISPIVESVCGIAVQEFLGKTGRELELPSDACDKFEAKCYEAMATNQPVRLEFDIDGRYYDCRLIPEYGSDDSLESMLGITEDITDRKQIQETLRRSEEKLAFVLNNVNVSISRFYVFANRDWKYDYYSPGCETIFGYSSAEMVENKTLWLSRVFPVDVENVILPKFEDIFCERTVSYEYRFEHKDGSLRWIYATLTSQHDEAQDAWIVTSIDSDITEQKRLQQEREELLTQAQAAREEAEVANRTKDEFLAIVSHELRSPLNSILGWSKLLQTRKFDEATTNRALKTIERNAKDQSQLIDDLLDVSRMIHKNLQLNLAPVNLASVIEVAINMVSPSAQGKQIQIQQRFDSTVGQVSGDFIRLQQIVVNLLTNAIKFTPNGGRVEIELTNSLNFVEVQVIDTGKGISPEFLPYVFEQFYRADNTTTRSKDGLGLGLAIVRSLVELHGGTVTAASPGVGQGATFTVKLPLIPSSTSVASSLTLRKKSTFEIN